MIASIMQPTYLPWIGYFDLIDQSDVFVFLDTVEFSRQSWQQRNRIGTPQGPIWLTVPVRHQQHQAIKDVLIDNTKTWRRKHWGSLATNYRRSPYWEVCAGALEPIYEHEWTELAELNIALIETMCGIARIDVPLVRASGLRSGTGERVQNLVAICTEIGADTYLSPLGASAYLGSATAFKRANIDLFFHHYQHPTYLQATAGFIDHLSFIDALMQLGGEAATAMRSGRRSNLQIADVIELNPEDPVAGNDQG